MFKHYIRTIPSQLNWMLVITILLIFFKIFVANQISEAFKGAYEIGVIIEGLLASIIASYIFYLIVVHFKM